MVFHKHNTLPHGPIQPSSPSTKELHELDKLAIPWSVCPDGVIYRLLGDFLSSREKQANYLVTFEVIFVMDPNISFFYLVIKLSIL